LTAGFRSDERLDVDHARAYLLDQIGEIGQADHQLWRSRRRLRGRGREYDRGGRGDGDGDQRQ